MRLTTRRMVQWTGHSWVGFAMLLLAACTPAVEQTETANRLGDATKPASPPERTAGYNEMRNAYFGDIHIHTRNSFDAYIFNVRRTADDAYRFARGQTVQHPAGFDMTIAGGPLDFYAVTDHAEYLGVLPAMDTPGHKLNLLPLARAMFSGDFTEITDAFNRVGASIRSGQPIADMDDRPLVNSVWAANVEAAKRHYQPGVFTTFAAYEYTAVSVTGRDDSSFVGGNLHRNVYFRDAAPGRTFSALDSTSPEDLWDWMDQQRADGMDAIAIPHNSNVSDGQMFRLETRDGGPLTSEYASQRMRNEPVVELTQVKGTSETHPALSPNDEWAGFEIYDRLLGAYDQVSKIPGSYVREAYGNGLRLAEEKGFNPFRFGLVGASDSHVVGGAYSERDYWSKGGLLDAFPENRGSVPWGGAKTWNNQPVNRQTLFAQNIFSRWAASGLTGVWAEENTRESIFSAFRRKETFATTGPRITVRFFAGLDYANDLADDPDLVKKAYEGGVAMGGDLVGSADGSAPVFLVWTQRDPNAAALQRAQIVKVTATGERVHDVVCHKGVPNRTTHRCPDNGATVDLTTCKPVGQGASVLKTVWRDPDFDPKQRATYYVRVLENPTCRWSTWEALRAGTPPNPELARTIQERAYTSPIWYIPAR